MNVQQKHREAVDKNRTARYKRARVTQADRRDYANRRLHAREVNNQGYIEARI